MLALYLGALALGAGIFAIQLLGGHEGEAEAEAEAEAEVGGHGDHGDHGDAPWLLFASLRFWAFASLTFGLVGTLLRLFDLASPALTGVVSASAALVFALAASWSIRALGRRAASSHVQEGELVGRLGRVIVPVSPDAYGKVRVELKGTMIDLRARSLEPLAMHETVVVEELEGEEALVSRAPRELAP